MADADDGVRALAEIFPDKSEAFLRAILRGKGGNVEAAAESLMGGSSSSGPSRGQHQQQQQQWRPSGASSTDQDANTAHQGARVPSRPDPSRPAAPYTGGLSAADRMGLDPEMRAAAARAMRIHGQPAQRNHQQAAFKPHQQHRQSRGFTGGRAEFPSLGDASSVAQPRQPRGGGPPVEQAPWGDASSAPEPTFVSERIETSAPPVPQYPSLEQASSMTASNKARGGTNNSNDSFGTGGAGATPTGSAGGRAWSSRGKGMSMADKLRLERVAEELYWVPRPAVEEAFLQRSMQSDATREFLYGAYQSPPAAEIEAHRERVDAARREEARSAQLKRGAVPLGMGSGQVSTALQSAEYDPSAEVSPWLSTGREVLDLYTRLRSEARDAARERNRCFMQSTEAYKAGDAARAAALSKQGRAANDKMRDLHARACDAIFEARNKDNDQRAVPVIDLHGLHIAEVTEQVLPYAMERYGDRETVRVVTGTGHHSRDSGTGAHGMGRLESAVADWLAASGYAFKVLTDANGRGGQFLVQISQQ